MAVTQSESDKLLAQAQVFLDEMRRKETSLERKKDLAKRISDIVRWATNIEMEVCPETGSMSGRMVPR